MVILGWNKMKPNLKQLEENYERIEKEISTKIFKMPSGMPHFTLKEEVGETDWDIAQKEIVNTLISDMKNPEKSFIILSGVSGSGKSHILDMSREFDLAYYGDASIGGARELVKRNKKTSWVHDYGMDYTRKDGHLYVEKVNTWKAFYDGEGKTVIVTSTIPLERLPKVINDLKGAGIINIKLYRINLPRWNAQTKDHAQAASNVQEI